MTKLIDDGFGFMKLFFNLIFEINFVYLTTPLLISEPIKLNFSLFIILFGLMKHIVILIPILTASILQKDHLKYTNLPIT